MKGQLQATLYSNHAASDHSKLSSQNAKAESLDSATPPHEIVTASPGSASQSVRRKASKWKLASTYNQYMFSRL